MTQNVFRCVFHHFFSSLLSSSPVRSCSCFTWLFFFCYGRLSHGRWVFDERWVFLFHAHRLQRKRHFAVIYGWRYVMSASFTGSVWIIAMTLAVYWKLWRPNFSFYCVSVFPREKFRNGENSWYCVCGRLRNKRFIVCWETVSGSCCNGLLRQLPVLRN